MTKAVCATTQTPCDTETAYTFACDETADCPTVQGAQTAQNCYFENGQSNCADTPDDFANNFGVGDDGFDPVQLCKTTAECGAGKTCALKSCKFGTTDNDDQQTIKLQVCGTPTNCQ